MGKGGLSCGGSIMKCLLFIFNLFFWLCGAGLMTLGIILLVDDSINKYLEIITWDQNDPTLIAAAIVILCTGVFTLLVGFCGCCGAIRESSCLLCMYAVFMVVVICAEFAAVILAIIFQADFNSAVEAHMAEDAGTRVKDEYTNTDPITAAWHYMQVELKCCGGTNFNDYDNNSYFDPINRPVPRTCCVLSNSDAENPEPVNQAGCYNEARLGIATDFLHGKGCYQALNDWFSEYAWAIIGLGIGVIAAQILGLIFACCVRKEINEYGVTA